MSKHAGLFSMVSFVVVFVIATYAVSQLNSIAQHVLKMTASGSEVLLGIGYLIVTTLSVLFLGRMIYRSERTAGRVKRRVRFFE